MVFSNPGTLGNDGLHSLEQVRKTKVMMERDRATPRTETTADAEGIAIGAIGGSADWMTGRLADWQKGNHQIRRADKRGADPRLGEHDQQKGRVHRAGA